MLQPCRAMSSWNVWTETSVHVSLRWIVLLPELARGLLTKCHKLYLPISIIQEPPLPVPLGLLWSNHPVFGAVRGQAWRRASPIIDVLISTIHSKVTAARSRGLFPSGSKDCSMKTHMARLGSQRSHGNHVLQLFPKMWTHMERGPKKKTLGLFWLVVSQAWDLRLAQTCANPKHQMMWMMFSCENKRDGLVKVDGIFETWCPFFSSPNHWEKMCVCVAPLAK